MTTEFIDLYEGPAIEDDDEDPPCECYYIAADVADASLCRVHGEVR